MCEARDSSGEMQRAGSGLDAGSLRTRVPSGGKPRTDARIISLVRGNVNGGKADTLVAFPLGPLRPEDKDRGSASGCSRTGEPNRPLPTPCRAVYSLEGLCVRVAPGSRESPATGLSSSHLVSAERVTTHPACFVTCTRLSHRCKLRLCLLSHASRRGSKPAVVRTERA